MDIEERIKAAIARITSGQCSMRVPAEETDPDLVLADCLREIMRLRNPWQPIDTAPKDGTVVLLWDGIETTGYWQNYTFSPGSWCLCISGAYAQDAALDGPTHWAPLPAEPDSKPSA